MATLVSLRSDEFRPPLRSIREHEIIRVLVELPRENTDSAVGVVRKLALDWAATKTAGTLPKEAWDFEPFDHVAGGRGCFGVRHRDGENNIWAIRSEDPDKSFPDRVWTTEITVSQARDRASLAVRLLASSRELRPEAEPAVPAIVKQVLGRMPLCVGTTGLRFEPVRIGSENEAERLLSHLIDPERMLPVCVMSSSSWSPDEYKPLIQPELLTRSLTGLCTVVILPARFTWVLSRAVGKMLAVYEGAVRIYWPGFSEDADPFTHDLMLASHLSTEEARRAAVSRIKWSIASYSVRFAKHTKAIRPFTALRSLQMSARQESLLQQGATDKDQLAAAHALIRSLRGELEEAKEQVQWLSDEHDEAETRAKQAEELSGRSGFRIQQLLAQLAESGQSPDEKIVPPSTWVGFEEWCDEHLEGRVRLTQPARRTLGDSEFGDPATAAQCLLWLANEYRIRRMEGGDGSLRDVVVMEGIRNSPCGGDAYLFKWQGEHRDVDWHIKNGGNTRDPNRCLRIYYFWDEPTQQVVVTHMPGHRVTGAS